MLSSGKGGKKRAPPSKQQPHEVYVNESGLYSLVLRSTKQEAKAFKRWVTSEVLPSIRQNGSYVRHVIQYKVISMAKPQPSKEERRMLRVGKALESDEVEQLNEMENMVQLSTWLDSRVRAPNREARRKILDAFRKGCKVARLQQADEEGNLVPTI